MPDGIQGPRALVIGCHGGLGRAVLALLERTDPGRGLRRRLGALILADRRPPPVPVSLLGAEVLSPVAVTRADDLAALIRLHRITQVIDLSCLDTVDCTRACDELGADYLCTSVEEWPAGQPSATDEATARLLPPARLALTRRGHLVGSGANPGIVNALVFAGLEQLARRAGVRPTIEDLELYAVLITEDDTTGELGEAAERDAFPMTWSPRNCLEELLESRAFACRDGRVADLGHRPAERRYRARCGDRIIAGMAVPHEQIVTLAGRLPGVEIAMVYRLPPAARRALTAHPERRPGSAWRIHRLYPPWSGDLTGRDRVGVLLCSRRYGELWLGYDTDVATGLALGTNATQLQVAAGVLAGWSQLGSRKGIHFVEDLAWREFLDVVGQVLGPPMVVHDAAAPAASFARRIEPAWAASA